VEPTIITAIIGLIGTGLGFLIRRADRRREMRETMLIKHLEEQLVDERRENRRLRLINRILQADGTAWREQLIRNDIEPEPATWTKPPEEEA
jgi:hypothetical protein